MQRISKKIHHFITMGILLAMMLNTVPVFASSAYEPVVVLIPVEYQDKKDSTGLYVTISSEDPNAPLPATSELFLTDGEKQNFEIAVSEPGTYEYEVNYVIDETATEPATLSYIVNLYAIANGDDLKVDIAMGKKGETSKSEECLFLNVKRGGHPDLDEDNSGSDKSNKNGSSSNAASSGRNRTGTAGKGSSASTSSVKTGDSSRMRFYGILTAMSLFVILFLIKRKKTTKKQSD